MIWLRFTPVTFLPSQEAIVPTTNGWRHQLYTFTQVAMIGDIRSAASSVL